MNLAEIKMIFESETIYAFYQDFFLKAEERRERREKGGRHLNPYMCERQAHRNHRSMMNHDNINLSSSQPN